MLCFQCFERTSGFQAGFIAVVAALNFAGIEQVGHGSLIFMLLLLTPFVLVTVIAFTGVFTGVGVLGWEFKSSNLLGTIDEVSCLFHTLHIIPFNLAPSVGPLI